MRSCCPLLLAVLVLTNCSSTQSAGEQWAYDLDRDNQQGSYLLYLPEDYTPDDGTWPLLLFLHGAGERGGDVERVAVHGPPKLVEAGESLPFIIASPQCPLELNWSDRLDFLDALLDELIETYRVDETRVYVTGLSMGGFGTWALAAAYPDRFAALAPVCGGGDAATVCTLRHVPTWVFHGDADTVVPIERSQVMVDSLRACEADVQFTIYPGIGHDSWTPTYDNPRLYEWLLEQRLAR